MPARSPAKLIHPPWLNQLGNVRIFWLNFLRPGLSDVPQPPRIHLARGLCMARRWASCASQCCAGLPGEKRCGWAVFKRLASATLSLSHRPPPAVRVFGGQGAASRLRQEGAEGGGPRGGGLASFAARSPCQHGRDALANSRVWGGGAGGRLENSLRDGRAFACDLQLSCQCLGLLWSSCQLARRKARHSEPEGSNLKGFSPKGGRSGRKASLAAGAPSCFGR